MGSNGIIKLIVCLIAPLIMYVILPEGGVSKGGYCMYGALIGTFMFLSGYFTEKGS